MKVQKTSKHGMMLAEAMPRLKKDGKLKARFSNEKFSLNVDAQMINKKLTLNWHGWKNGCCLKNSDLIGFFRVALASRGWYLAYN